jgi:hypothetical protein
VSAGPRHPLREARAVVGEGDDPRVLEPSPPAVDKAPWFADDPVAVGAAPTGRVVSPVPGGDLTWGEWLADHPDRAGWAGARWLGAYRRLPAPPAGLAETRVALHRVAVYAVAPARRRANARIGLRWTLGGLGTPFFGADEQVRVVGATLVRQRGAAAETAPITTLTAAAELALDGPPDLAWAEGLDVPPPGDPAAPLAVEPAAAAFLGDWCGFAWSVLEELRAEPESTDPTRVQLWPEHFDAAFECLGGPDGRVTFGASPGDGAVDEPYLYALGPGGALTTMRLAELSGALDQRGAALGFYRRQRARLAMP